jgi:lipopolysaccharide/colanic/teichoic acid biosynthesis glycosyltransferase
LVFLWWLLAIIWALIRVQSPGPGIFAQQRVGRNGRIFTCYKFRTMYEGTVQGPTNEVPLSQVTWLGNILRRSKLDELPQVWNILRNEFSLIGPRPCLPMQTGLVEARTRLGVLALKPGISGLSQVEGIEMSEPERLAVNDARYLALQSLQMDLKIMIETVAVVFRSLK